MCLVLGRAREVLKTVAFLMDLLQIPQKSERIYTPCLLSHLGSTANVEQTDHSYVAFPASQAHKKKISAPSLKSGFGRGEERETQVVLHVPGSFSRVCLALTLTTVKA